MDGRRHASTDAAIRDLVDKESIREVLYTCCRALDRCDAELLKSLYHPDGFNAHGPFAGNAHEFCDWVIPRLRAHQSIRHSIGNVLVDIDGDRAFCESQYQVSTRTTSPEGELVDTGSEGRYLDVLVRCEDLQWRIFHRLVVNDKRWTRPVTTHDASAPAPADPNTGPRADRSDPVYRGFGIMDLRSPSAPRDQ